MSDQTEPRNGPPPRESGGRAHTLGPAHTQVDDNHDTHADYIAGLKRRRAATYRVQPLDCGCRDPWICRSPSERMVDAYREAVLTISAVGMTPAPFLPEMRIMWRRGGTDRDLVRTIATRWEVAA